MWSRSHSQDLQLAFPAVQPHSLAAQPRLTGGEGRADGVLSNFLAAGLEVGKGPPRGSLWPWTWGSGQFKFCEPREDLLTSRKKGQFTSVMGQPAILPAAGLVGRGLIITEALQSRTLCCP